MHIYFFYNVLLKLCNKNNPDKSLSIFSAGPLLRKFPLLGQRRVNAWYNLYLIIGWTLTRNII